MKFLNNLDLQSNELQNAVIHNYAGNPDGNLSGTEGQIVYSTTTDALYVNTDGATTWSKLSAASGTVTSVTAGGGIVVGGTSTDPQVSHADTSSVSDLTASARTYVTGMTFDTYGHVQTVSTATETVTNSDTTYSVSVGSGGANSSEIVLTAGGSGSGTDSIEIEGGSNVTITESGDVITIASANDNDIDYVSGASFSGGTLTLTGVGNAGASVSLDGRYLQSETEGFKTVSVAGQSDVVADSAGDTLTLVAGSNVTITTSAAGDSVTIAAANDGNDIDYVNAASFTGGTLTLTGVGNAGASISLDGRYLQSESDTLDSVTGRGNTTTNAITVGDLTVNGDLTVSGNHIVKLAEELQIEDSLFVLNSNETGTPSEDAGFVIERGTSTNVGLIWDESADQFYFATTAETGTTQGNVTFTASADVQTGNLTVDGQAVITTINNAAADRDKFVVAASDGTLEYRTGAQVLSDIGAGTGNGSMDDFTITDGSTATTVSDGSTVTIEGSGLVSVDNTGGTFTVSTTANNYVHPTQSAINASGTGATVVDGVTVNTLGHTTAVSTRALTLADLGYTGATNANNYVLPSATTSVVGGVELATQAEAEAGTSTSVVMTPDNVSEFFAARRFKASIGNGTDVAFTVTHNLGTTDVIVQLFDVSSGETVFADVERSSVNAVEIAFGAAPATNDIRVLIMEL